MPRKLLSFLIVLWLLNACAPAPRVTVQTPTASVSFTPRPDVLATETPAPQVSHTPSGSATPSPTPEPTPLTYAEALLMLQTLPSTPFDLQVVSSEVQDGVTIQDITYAAADPQYTMVYKGRIKAYIVTPPGNGPFAGILFAHGLGSNWGNRDEFLQQAIDLAHQGVTSILPTGLFPWTVSHTGVALEDQISILKQVIELRRSLDLLLNQPNIDPNRIAFVGHDYGAMHGALLAGVDKRVTAFVLMTGDINYSNWALGYFVRPARPKDYQQSLAAVDPVSYLPNAAPAALYFQYARQDGFIDPKQAEELYAAASQPKKIDWYDAGHTLNDQAREDRLAWLASQLELKPAPAE